MNNAKRDMETKYDIPVNWSGRREIFEPLLMSLQSSDYNHSIPLSRWYLD